MKFEEVIENELKCVQRDCCRVENECAKCDLVLPQSEITTAFNEALKLNESLREAKEIIQELYSQICDRACCSDELLDRAEQFLKNEENNK